MTDRRHEGALALGGRTGKAGKLLEGLGGADGPFRNSLPEQPVGDFPQGRVHVPAQRRELIAAGRVVRQEQPGQPAGAERERHGEFRLGVPAEHDLHGAAADVEDQQPPRRPAVPLVHGQVDQPGLVLAAEVLRPDADFGLDPVQDQVAVGGVAHRRGGEHVELLNAEPPGRVHGVVHRLDHPVDAGRVDGAVRAERLAEQGRLFDRVRRQRRRAGACLEDLQLGRVRADVQDSEQHPPGLPPARRIMQPTSMRTVSAMRRCHRGRRAGDASAREREHTTRCVRDTLNAAATARRWTQTPSGGPDQEAYARDPARGAGSAAGEQSCTRVHRAR